MKNLVLGAFAGLILSAAALATPAMAAPVPTAAGALATDNAGIVQVQMMNGDRMMMRDRMHRRMMMRDRMMMRHRMMRHRMMHRRMMRNM